MAIAIHAETVGKRKVTLNGTVSAYDLIAHNGTNWVTADATDETLPAALVALQAGASGDVVEAAPYVVLTDSDAPYTVDTTQYLSETAGAHTETRVTTAAALRQVVGHSVDTSTVVFDVGFTEVDVRGVEVLLQDTAARLINDAGPAAGVVLAAVNDNVVYGIAIPENAISIVTGYAPYGADVALDASDTVSVTVASTVSGKANDANTDSLAATGLSVAADSVANFDLSTALNAAALVEPGGSLFINLIKAAEGTGGDDPIFMAPHVIFKVTK